MKPQSPTLARCSISTAPIEVFDATYGRFPTTTPCPKTFSVNFTSSVSPGSGTSLVGRRSRTAVPGVGGNSFAAEGAGEVGAQLAQPGPGHRPHPIPTSGGVGGGGVHFLGAQADRSRRHVGVKRRGRCRVSHANSRETRNPPRRSMLRKLARDRRPTRRCSGSSAVKDVARVIALRDVDLKEADDLVPWYPTVEHRAGGIALLVLTA